MSSWDEAIDRDGHTLAELLVDTLLEILEVLKEIRNELAKIPEKLNVEEFDYYLIESPEYQYLIERQNRMNRALAREIREIKEQFKEIKEQLNFMETLIRQRKDLMPKDALMW